jgi:hypothetical protein
LCRRYPTSNGDGIKGAGNSLAAQGVPRGAYLNQTTIKGIVFEGLYGGRLSAPRRFLADDLGKLRQREARCCEDFVVRQTVLHC